MNILLTNGLPDEIDGVEIYTDFRNMIQVSEILQDKTLIPQERTILALSQLYSVIPSDISKAIEGLMWFYLRGNNEKSSPETGSQKQAIDFEQDASTLYASFYSAYQIQLTDIDYMHWWEFMALLEGLPDTTLMSRIMYWRTVDVSKLDKYERKHVLQMRERFALHRVAKEKMSADELEERTKQKIAQRFEMARKRLEGS